jgi:hypothetical protein
MYYHYMNNLLYGPIKVDPEPQPVKKKQEPVKKQPPRDISLQAIFGGNQKAGSLPMTNITIKDERKRFQQTKKGAPIPVVNEAFFSD